MDRSRSSNQSVAIDPVVLDPHPVADPQITDILLCDGLIATVVEPDPNMVGLTGGPALFNLVADHRAAHCTGDRRSSAAASR